MKKMVIIIFIFLSFLTCHLSLPQASALESHTYYYHTDQVGSVVAVSDENGKLIEENKYSPYGSDLTLNASRLTLESKYTGQKKDSSTTLNYYNARYYDPTISRFTSADPTNDQQNRYNYVGGNPVIRNDPTGNDAWWNDPKKSIKDKSIIDHVAGIALFILSNTVGLSGCSQTDIDMNNPVPDTPVPEVPQKSNSNDALAFDAMAKSVVGLTYYYQSRFSIGTGTVVRNDSNSLVILTSGHSFIHKETLTQVDIELFGEPSNSIFKLPSPRYTIAGVDNYDSPTGPDVGLVGFKNLDKNVSGIRSIPFMSVNPNWNPSLNDELYTRHYPGGERVVSQKINLVSFLGYPRYSDKLLLTDNSDIEQGSSGGPMVTFGPDGKPVVVAVLSGYNPSVYSPLYDYQNLTADLNKKLGLK